VLLLPTEQSSENASDSAGWWGSCVFNVFVMMS
jgi:hypothetical protein